MLFALDATSLFIAGSLAQNIAAMLSRPRIKNEASPKDISKCLRANLKGIDSQALANADLDALVKVFKDCILDIIKATGRPTVKLLELAAVEAFEGVDANLGHFFGQRMTAAVTYCRNKLKGSTSGAKLQPAVREVCALLQEQSLQEGCRPTLGQKFLARARQLHRQSSSPNAPKQQALEDGPLPAQSASKKPKVDWTRSSSSTMRLEAYGRVGGDRG